MKTPGFFQEREMGTVFKPNKVFRRRFQNIEIAFRAFEWRCVIVASDEEIYRDIYLRYGLKQRFTRTIIDPVLVGKRYTSLYVQNVAKAIFGCPQSDQQ